MSEFTKEQLARLAGLGTGIGNDVAAFARAQMERAEKAEAKVIDCGNELSRALGHLSETEAERDRLKVELDSVLLHADRVMFLLDEHGASILPHLMDDDENPGEMLRRAVRRARERAK